MDTARAQVAQDQGTIESDQAQVANARLQLTYCRITAPIAGRIGLRLVDVGNIVQATGSTNLAVITQVQPIAVIFTLPQSDIPAVLTAMKHGTPPVHAYGRDLQHQIAAGTLLAINNQVDPTTGTVQLKARFVNQNNALFPNDFVNVKLRVNTLSGAVLIPAAAVQKGPLSTFVYVVKANHTVGRQTVVPGPTYQGRTAITKGLVPGEMVVTDGVDKLRQGMKVMLRQGLRKTSTQHAKKRP